MPLLPASLIEPLWVQFAALIGTDQRPEYDPSHPLGCHRHRVDDRVVFDCVIAALVHGSGYERVAVPGCSDRTIRRHLADWAEHGVTKQLLCTALAGYDRMLGLDLEDLSVDGSITKSPCGGEVSGPSPVDRAKQGTKRSVVTDGAGIPLHLVAAAANAHDSPLLEPTLAGVPDAVGPLPNGACVHLDARVRLRQDQSPAAHPGLPAPDRDQGHPSADPGRQALGRGADPLLDERYGKLRRSTDTRQSDVEFFLFLAAALTVIRRLITPARHHYRWDTMPTTRRLR